MSTRHGVLVVVALTAAAPATAKDWTFSLTPYYWGTGFESAAIVEDEETSNSGSVLDYLDAGILLQGSARRGPFVLIGEFNWLDFSDDIDRPAFLRGEARLTGTMAALAAGWAVSETPTRRVELLAGVRHWDIATEFKLRDRDIDGPSTTITDPILGVLGHWQPGARWGLTLHGDVGGFGVGSAYQISAMGEVTYGFTDVLHGALGYRALHVDLGDDGIQTMTFHGPYAGLEFRF